MANPLRLAAACFGGVTNKRVGAATVNREKDQVIFASRPRAGYERDGVRWAVIMRYILPILPFLGAMALLGCGERGPVAENAIAPPTNMAGDAGSTGLGAPGNAAAAAAHDAAAVPVATDGMAWITAADGRGAVYGGAGGVKMLSLDCQPGTRQLSITRHAGAPDDGAATMSLTGSGHASSLPVVASRADDGAMEWRAVAGGDMARAFARAFASDGPVQMTIGGAPDLIIPANASVRAIMARCIGG